ncbi:anti-sigma factor family protein [Sphingomonas morindae]|uniref:Anti-sigma factor n=1 Tax=Sphingomonas morindae TaxID=1541170 RepID=A0ABY4X6U3_9SPHN|nr:anti-sigma factor [Sphingomonas morindae]USI72570.1 anti-sigma factor [Sphingomonas morindae]
MTAPEPTEAELQAHVDGCLPPARIAAVTAWLGEHPDEAARLRAYADQRDALRAALAPVAAEAVPPALDPAHFVGAAPAASSARPRRGWARAAAVLLLGAAAGWTLRGWQAPPTAGTAALAREAVASYAVYARDPARPVEMPAAARGTLDGWFSARLSRPVAAPDLAAAGLRLIGGRLVATDHGPAGLYLYQDRGGRRIALYLRPMEVDRNDRMTARAQSGLSGWTWADDGLGFGLFGAAPSGTLHAAATLVRAQFRRV